MTGARSSNGRKSAGRIRLAVKLFGVRREVNDERFQSEFRLQRALIRRPLKGGTPNKSSAGCSLLRFWISRDGENQQTEYPLTAFFWGHMMFQNTLPAFVSCCALLLTILAGCQKPDDNANTTATTSVAPPRVQNLTVIPRPQRIVDMMESAWRAGRGQAHGKNHFATKNGYDSMVRLLRLSWV